MRYSELARRKLGARVIGSGTRIIPTDSLIDDLVAQLHSVRGRKAHAVHVYEAVEAVSTLLDSANEGADA